MKKFASFLVIGVLLAGLVLTGCEKKSDTEKAMNGLKKDVNALSK